MQAECGEKLAESLNIEKRAFATKTAIVPFLSYIFSSTEARHTPTITQYITCNKRIEKDELEKYTLPTLLPFLLGIKRKAIQLCRPNWHSEACWFELHFFVPLSTLRSDKNKHENEQVKRWIWELLLWTASVGLTLSSSRHLSILHKLYNCACMHDTCNVEKV